MEMPVQPFAVALDHHLDQPGEGGEGIGAAAFAARELGRNNGDGAQGVINVPLGHARGVLVEKQADGPGGQQEVGGRHVGMVAEVFAEEVVSVGEAELVGRIWETSTWIIVSCCPSHPISM
jgi:hypothetical protein